MQRQSLQPSRRRILQSTGTFGAVALAGRPGSPFGDSCSAGTDSPMAATTSERIADSVSSTVADPPPIAARATRDALDDGHPPEPSTIRYYRIS